MSVHTVATVRRPSNLDRPGAVEVINVKRCGGPEGFAADRLEHGEDRTYFGTSPGRILNAMAARSPHVEQVGLACEQGHVERHLLVK